MTAAEPPLTPTDRALDWTADGQPRSRRFNDVYFSAEDGLAEARAVFLAGCGLPDAWSGRHRFVVGELGFGTGLNIAALLDAWRGSRPYGGTLHIFSVEAFPITADDAARALGAWPELGEVAEVLVRRWPGCARGHHRVELPEWGAILDVAVMDVVTALNDWSGRADAWFLDGFAPAANPDMWSDEVLALVAARSAPGVRAATFTVAGQVRRGLTTAGFSVTKHPGFGRKRERLEAVLPGVADGPTHGRVAIIGGGIAGAAAARAVRALGGEAIVIEAEHLGAGASGNPSALVTPRLDAGLGEAAQLFAEAFRRATQLYDEMPGAVRHTGVLQVAADPRDADRFTRIAASDLFEPEDLAMLGTEAAQRRLERTSAVVLDHARAQVVDPAVILRAWTGSPVTAKVAAIGQDDAGWCLRDLNGDLILKADAVILAAALANAELAPDLPLRPVRGQASWTLTPVAAPVMSGGGYTAPTADGLLFGATHDRDDWSLDVRPEDHQRNLALIAAILPNVAERIADMPLAGRASLRAVTPDNLPIAGHLAPAGLFALTGFGSRGFSLAPLLAEHVAALALGAPSPISAGAAALVAPDRFAARAARRGRS